MYTEPAILDDDGLIFAGDCGTHAESYASSFVAGNAARQGPGRSKSPSTGVSALRQRLTAGVPGTDRDDTRT